MPKLTERTCYYKPGDKKNLSKKVSPHVQQIIDGAHNAFYEFSQLSLLNLPVFPFDMRLKNKQNNQNDKIMHKIILDSFSAIANDGFNVTGYVLYLEDIVYIVGVVDVEIYYPFETGSIMLSEFWDTDKATFETVVTEMMFGKKRSYLSNLMTQLDEDDPLIDDIIEEIQNINEMQEEYYYSTVRYQLGYNDLDDEDFDEADDYLFNNDDLDDNNE